MRLVFIDGRLLQKTEYTWHGDRLRFRYDLTGAETITVVDTVRDKRFEYGPSTYNDVVDPLQRIEPLELILDPTQKVRNGMGR